MAVTLIVETGAVVPNANSYIDLAFARTYAEQYGLTLPADDDAAGSALLNAVTFLALYEPRFQGRRVDPEQALSWPRAGVRMFGFPVDTDAIPLQIKNAQVEASVLIASGELTFDISSGTFVKKEKVDVIETEYSDDGKATIDGNSRYPKIEALLQGFFNASNGGYRLTARHGF